MRAAAVLAMGGTVAACAAAWRRTRAVAAVDPALRSPVLLMPQTLHNRLALALARRAGAWPSPMPAGVQRGERLAELGGEEPVRVLTYQRAAGPEAGPAAGGALLWMHGGGGVLGEPEYDDGWCGAVAAELGTLVVSVDYRLAPEHPFPAALDDCFTVLRWLHGHAEALGVDPARVAVGGASAGGGLAAALAQRATDAGVPVAFQLLRYPMLDDRTALRRDLAGRGRLGWTPRSNRFAWRCYLGRRPGAATLPPYAAAARRVDLTGLPPAWVGVGDLDLFHDEDVTYARRLQASGVPCELLVVPRMYHGADGVRPGAATMRRFHDSAVEALRGALSPRD